MPSHRVPRRSTRYVRTASEKARLRAARGRTELHCFSRRGNLLSALFTRVLSFSLHYHYQRHHTSSRQHHYHCNRLVSSSIAPPATFIKYLDFLATLESTLRATANVTMPFPSASDCTLQTPTISFPLTYTADPRWYTSRKN